MKFLSILVLLFTCSGLLAQGDHPLLGTWKLNIEASDTRMRAPQMDVRQYTLREDGNILGLAVWVDADGNPGFLQFTGKTDGKRYPEYNSALLADLQANGTLSPQEFSETVIGDSNSEWTDLVNGETVASGTRVYSNDNNRMTININIQDAEGNPDTFSLVYDRQQ